MKLSLLLVSSLLNPSCYLSVITGVQLGIFRILVLSTEKGTLNTLYRGCIWILYFSDLETNEIA